MNKAAVSKAQLKRAVEALEAMGKVVGDVILRPDGSWQLRLTSGERPALTSDENASDEWDKALGLQ